jgi:hypothetical protein
MDGAFATAPDGFVMHGRMMPPGHLPRYFENHPRHQFNSSDPAEVARAISLVPMLSTLVFVFFAFALMVLVCRCVEQRRARLHLDDRIDELELGAKVPLRRTSPSLDRCRRVDTSAVPGLDMAEVREHLDACKLARYLESFEKNGYDDWSEIMAMGDDKLQLLARRTGMSPNHADRFLQFVERMQRPLAAG